MNIQPNPVVVEVTYEKSTISKLRKRIHLPPEIYAETYEERFQFRSTAPEYNQAKVAIENWMQAYNNYSIVWMDSKYAIQRSRAVEIIKRNHKLGNFILFRILRETNHGARY